MPVDHLADLPSVGASLAFGFLVALALSAVLTPIVRRLALSRSIVDRPGPRRVNTIGLPRSGGIAVGVAFVAALVAVGAIQSAVAGGAWLETSAGLVFGGGLAVVLGTVDDVLDLPWRWQLAGQALLAVFAFSAGIAITQFESPSGLVSLMVPVAALATMAWFLLVINSVNWIDGLDGLSTSIALCASSALLVVSLTTRSADPFLAVACACMIGALVGFLPFNWFPASVLIGTSGTLLVGFELAAIGILVPTKLVVLLVALAVPVFDALWTVARRVVAGSSPFHPDRSHVHHLLLDGKRLHHRGVVALLAAWTVALSICAVLAPRAWLVPLLTIVFLIVGVLPNLADRVHRPRGV